MWTKYDVPGLCDPNAFGVENRSPAATTAMYHKESGYFIAARCCGLFGPAPPDNPFRDFLGPGWGLGVSPGVERSGTPGKTPNPLFSNPQRGGSTRGSAALHLWLKTAAPSGA